MSGLRLFNTLAKEKQNFTPYVSHHVGIYACGPTVYDRIHVGNARPLVLFDILVKLLRYHYDTVMYVRNITDVDDKISDAALKQNTTVYEISNKYKDIYQSNMSSLDIMEPTYQPKVTDNMPAIIKTISTILKNGAAYVSEGHVIFDTNKYKNYGELSKRSLDDINNWKARDPILRLSKSMIKAKMWTMEQEKILKSALLNTVSTGIVGFRNYLDRHLVSRALRQTNFDDKDKDILMEVMNQLIELT